MTFSTWAVKRNKINTLKDLTMAITKPSQTVANRCTTICQLPLPKGTPAGGNFNPVCVLPRQVSVPRLVTVPNPKTGGVFTNYIK